MTVSLAQTQLVSAQKTLETCRRKQADEDKKAAALDKDGAAKESRARSATTASARAQYERDASRKRTDAAAARARAARHAEDAAKAQKRVHEAQAKLRSEEQREAKRLADKRATDDRRASAEQDRADRARELAHRREVQDLQSQIDEQARLLARAPWDEVPERIAVLFVASSPEDQDRLRIDREMREIQQKVRAADHRDSIQFRFAVAAQPADLLQQLNEVKPDVVHFSGHSDAAGLAMEDSDGQTRFLNTSELATLLSVSSRRIRLAVFNSCESADHAISATNHLDAAIGMDESVDDDAARVFASQLYGSIAFGLPLQKAFDQALLQVRLALGSSSGEPRLYTATGLSADDIVLVRDQGATDDDEGLHSKAARGSREVEAAETAARLRQNNEVIRSSVVDAVTSARRWAETMETLVIATASNSWQQRHWVEWVDTDSGRQLTADAQTMRDMGPKIHLSVKDLDLLRAVDHALTILDNSAAFNGVYSGASTPESRTTAYRHINEVKQSWAAVETAAARLLAE
jgi:hypothetical protein